MRMNEIIEDKNENTSLLDVLRKINKPEIIKHFNKNRIYRGIANEDRDFFTQKSGNRFNYEQNIKGSSQKAIRETAKLGAKLLNNLPSWKGYPSREHSYICSTASANLEMYGKKYVVFPLSNTNLAICPSDDFLFHFFIYDISNNWYETIEELRSNEIIDDNGNIKNFQSEETTHDGIGSYISDLEKMFSNKDSKTVLNAELDPKKHGIEIVSPLEYTDNLKEYEIWFEGEALFISLEYLKNGGQPQLDKYLYENK